MPMRRQSWFTVVVAVSLLLLVNCGTPEPPVTVTPSIEPPVTATPAMCQYTFDSFPDGRPISGDTASPTGTYQRLNGDEFSDWGFLVASTPVTGCVVVKTSYYSTPDNYLMLLDGYPCSGANRIEITFLQPVRQVTLAFSGASINYTMEVYDEAGNQLGAPIQEAEFDEDGRLFTISFESDDASVSRVRFGYTGTTVAVVAIREINTCDSGN
jgi:hypothetical protein